MEELVGRRFKLGVVGLTLGSIYWVCWLLDGQPDLDFVPVLLTVTGGMAALIDFLRPNRLRLSADHFDLITTWGGRRRVAWASISPAYLVKLQGKGRRTYDVVRFRCLPRRGRRGSEVTLPQDFEPTPLALLLLMNEFRDRAVGQRPTS